jgi:HAD superfamily hydrolase (TIGR01509 family)
MRLRLIRPVRGLLFDAGDVLYDATAWRRWLLQLLRRIGLYTNYRSFFHIWDHDFMADVYRGRRQFNEAFQAFLLSAGLSRAQIDEIEAACKARRKQWEATARPLPGVKSTLARLQAARIAMGVVCDSEHPAAVLRERLERFGLGSYFPTVISSIDLGHIKPEPICYETALCEMNLDASEAAFVGHDTQELAGAKRVGLQTIAFNFDQDAQADVFIARFEELVDLVANHPRYAAAG